jgi:2-dehydro-3-deoxy-D-arabinonate dehydratase|tara:strand:+ start:163 stop:996 length:834 start_codon:yes stop_codon:yes gene_type:complete
MKLYKKKNQVIVHFNQSYYLLNNQNWDLLVNDDNLFSKIKNQILSAPSVDKSEIKFIDPPIESQELWASGVTYLISKKERENESKKSGGSEFYNKVYNADRPELFFKATKNRISGNDQFVRIRKDSSWNVPEPELTLFATSNKKIIGLTIGNDMSSRSIEGENPLYLPQAKTYDGCASLGPCLYVLENQEEVNNGLEIKISIERKNKIIFNNSISTNQMKRSNQELINYLFRECSFPNGVFLMTGTGIVPPKDITLNKNDIIKISIENIGILINKVK